MRPLPLLLLILAPLLHAADDSPAALARLAPSTGDVVTPLTAGLLSADALLRATGPPVAAIRGEESLVPALREALTDYTNYHAAPAGNLPLAPTLNGVD